MDEYQLERTFLAMECAEALGIKPIPQILYDFAVKTSELPKYDSKGRHIGISESSLLSMGVVYCYGSTFRFIDTSGHTCLLPYNAVIKKELEKCGYTVCAYGEKEPDFGYNRGMNGVNFDDPGFNDAFLLEMKTRDKCTLPERLAKRVKAHEQLHTMEKYDKYEYDVFSHELYRGRSFSHTTVSEILLMLGYDDRVARRFMALNGYEGSIFPSVTTIEHDLKTFLVYASKHPILNDTLYYAPGGVRDQLSGKIEKASEASIKNF